MDVTASLPLSAPLDQLAIINCSVVIIRCWVLINLRSHLDQSWKSFLDADKRPFVVCVV